MADNKHWSISGQVQIKSLISFIQLKLIGIIQLSHILLKCKHFILLEGIVITLKNQIHPSTLVLDTWQ